MQNKMILVIGGARSGKSSFSEKYALECGMKPFYIATAPCLDDEMRARIALHRAQREHVNWTTIESQVQLVEALQEAVEKGADTILVDCLTLWINNLLYEDSALNERIFSEKFTAILAQIKSIPCPITFVINEVGLGIVPESQIARTFRDISGRCAQMLASASDEVYWMVAGISQRIK